MTQSAKHRVLITGRGLVSAIGNETATVVQALHAGQSGIRRVEQYAELGLNSQVAGVPDLASEPAIDRKLRRFMADAAIFAHHATRKAAAEARLSTQDLQHPRTGLIIGSGVGSPYQHHQSIEIFRSRGINRVPPYFVPQIMGSTASANLALAFGIRGPSYSLSSACASSAHAIGHGAEQIRHGILDRVIVGGTEELGWTTTMPFDALGALSRRWNHSPQTASRPFDRDRDGFVIAGGAGILILEAEETARARGATIYGEIAGYAACSEGQDMVQPDAGGAARAMRAALAQAGNPRVDYINPHATSTPLGDIAEIEAIRTVFGDQMPLVAATKGLTGHAIAASGAQEAIYCLLMMEHGFVAGSANLFDPDPACAGVPILRQSLAYDIDVALTNSIGFGGTNASLVLRRYRG